MNNENDLIAEYIKENYPELIATMDFALFRIRKACQQFTINFLDSFKKIDLSELKKSINDFNQKKWRNNDGRE